MPRSAADKPEFLRSIANYRGIAIVLIVAAHCFVLVGWRADSFAEKLLENLIKGGTALFVFISGFLFHHVFAGNFDYRRFVAKKSRFVLLPYLVLSAFPIIWYVGVENGGPFAELIYSGRDGVWAQYVQPALKYLWSGRHLQAYWYIPFIMVVFAASPVFLRYLRLPLGWRLAILLVTLGAAMLVHRPVKNISVFQSVAYFLPVYLAGMNVSLHRKAVLERLTGREWLLAVGVLGLAVMQVALYDKYSNHHKPAFEWGGVDPVMPQKLLACLLLYVVLERFRDRQWRLLDILAASSFAIYFLHPLILVKLREHATYDWPIISALPDALGWLVWVAIIIAASYGIGRVVRMVSGRYSRQLIGW